MQPPPHTRRAEKYDLSGNIVFFHSCLDTKCNAHASNRDQIVSACMPNPRECIHFRVHAHHGSICTVLECGAPCGSELEIVWCDGEPVGGHESCEEVMCKPWG